MFPILYKKDETNFVHNGLGVLSGAITAVPEEELNGLFEIKIEYDSEGFLADQIENGMIVKAKANDKQDPQLFRIYAIEKDMESDIYIIHGQHITYDLAGNFVEELILEKATLKEAMEGIQKNLTYPTRFNITSSNNTTTSSTRLYRTNPLQMIGGMEGSILQFWGGQIERDNFNLIMHKRRGSDDGVLVTYKKNLTGLEAKFDESNVVTRIFPFKYIAATEDEPEQLITIDGKFIDSPHINKYPIIKILPLDLSDEEDIKNKTDLYNASKDFFNEGGKDLPTVEMEVEFEPLWDTEEYKDVAALELVGMGDTITVRHSKMDIDVQASVVKIEYDSIAEKNKKVSIGNVKARLTDTVNNASNIANTIDEKLQNANQKANEAIKAANGKNTIYYGTDEPTGDHLIEGDLWFRVVDGEYTRTYRYDGVQWQLVVSADIRDIEEEAEEARRAAENAVANANLATGNALEAIEQAQGAFNEATSAHTIADAANDLADVTNKLALTIKETVDGHSVQIKENETEISRKMSTVDANAKFATQSQLTQTSSSLTSEIAKVQGNLDGLEFNVKNLLLNSGNEVTTSEYNTKEWRLSENLIADQKYTFIFRGSLGAGKSYFGIYMNHGSSQVLRFERVAGTNTFVGTFTAVEEMVGREKVLRAYAVPSNVSVDSTIEWAGLYKGVVKPPMDWTPAPEELTTNVQFSKLQQTVDSISGQVTKKVDKTVYDSFVQQTAQSLSSKISQQDADKKYATQSSLTQTAQGLQSQVDDKASKSQVTQLAGVVDTKVTSSQVNNLIATDKRIKDTRNDNMKPSYYFSTYPRQTVREFKLLSVIGISGEGSYGVLETDIPWGDKSGGSIKQTLYTDVATYERRGINSSDTWEAWKKIADTQYVSSQITQTANSIQQTITNTKNDLQSQISQLSDAINLRVIKNDVINQINLDTSGILIQGKKLTLDGNVNVTGTFKVNNANIVSVDAGKMTTGTLDAGKVSVININAANIKTGKLNANNVTISATNGNAKLDLSANGLHSYDSNGKLRIALNIRSAGGAGSDPATLRFFSGNGSVSAGIGMNVNDDFIIGSQSDKVSTSIYSGKNQLYWANQHRFVFNDGPNTNYWIMRTVVDGDGDYHPGLFPTRSGAGYLGGNNNNRLWRIYSNYVHYVDLVNLSSRDSKANIEDANIKEMQAAFDEMDLVTFNYKNEDGGARSDELKIGWIAEDSPSLVTSKDKKQISLNNTVGVIAGSLKHQTNRVDQMEEIIERQALKIASLEERLNKLEVA